MLFATMLERNGPALKDFLTHILYNLCETTLEMIKIDWHSFPDFREGYFLLIKAIVEKCTEGLFQLE